jgi:hypothetical protein
VTTATKPGDDEEPPRDTADAETTTTTLSPEDAFIADLERQLTVEGPPGFGENALEFLTGVCDDLDEFSEFESEAEEASPESDAMVGEFAITTTLAIVLDETDYPPEVGAVLLRAMSDHLCPQHSAAVEEIHEARDL